MLTDKELMEQAETWLNIEMRKIPRKLGLTQTQMTQVVLRCTSKFLKDYVKTIKDEDEAEPKS